MKKQPSLQRMPLSEKPWPQAEVETWSQVEISIPAATFYLDRRGGWKQTVELTGKDGGPITLAAMREAFAAEIEGTAKPVSKKKAKQITDERE